MKITCLKNLSLTVFGILLSVFAVAQDRPGIGGKVVNEQGAAVASATVFLSGTKHITATNDQGRFSFEVQQQGSYQLVVKMLGYQPYTQNVIVGKKNIDVAITLSPASTQLREVTVGGDPGRQRKYDLFKQNFLGSTTAGGRCKILNPDVLTLKDNRTEGTLTATSDDFLIIDNPSLGYRVKYLLKDFTYHYNSRTTNYTGDAVFEEMYGTDKARAEWKADRLKAYQGSLMHFLRSVFKDKGEALTQGFLARSILIERKQLFSNNSVPSVNTLVVVESQPVGFDSLVKRVDTALVMMKFKRSIGVDYDPRATAKRARGLFAPTAVKTENLLMDKNSSILQPAQEHVLIDSRGNVTDHRAFLIKGRWADMRLGDQLPFEYQPES